MYPGEDLAPTTYPNALPTGWLRKVAITLPHADRVEIGEDGRRCRPVGGFAQTDETTRQNMISKIDVKPDAPLARLQRMTPRPMIFQREVRSASQPKRREQNRRT